MHKRCGNYNNTKKFSIVIPNFNPFQIFPDRNLSSYSYNMENVLCTEIRHKNRTVISCTFIKLFINYKMASNSVNTERNCKICKLKMFYLKLTISTPKV